jgi:hypothetical protein
MQQMREGPPAVAEDRSRRRPPRKRIPSEAELSLPDLERLLRAHETAIRAQLADGLQVLYRGTIKLMRQVAAEAWQAGGPGSDDRLQERIVHALSRDDALRSLLAQGDERQQALSLRVDRIERAIRHLIRANREALTDANQQAGSALVARAGRRTEELVRQREERVERRLDGLHAQIEALARSMEAPSAAVPNGRPGSGDRLRALERRLTRISGELEALAGGPAEA